ncbi:unnamed protein product [Psylliodes chrysocephalus]|uniref:Uncharacterized protein n=1 Tax=Psylliodes chrysocephalus TaxID=3402493 RepID=A0A9P0D4U4_9CUCU|nr:unnamed protein product [Psylliodes chrysocephala]
MNALAWDKCHKSKVYYSKAMDMWDPDFEQPGSSSGSESDEDVTIQIKQRPTTANREEQVIANNTNKTRHNRGKNRAIKGDTRAVRQHRKEKRNTGQEYKKLSNQSGITVADGRGKSAPPNKRTLQDIENVRQHILSVPTYESHYTRRDSTKKYLPPYVTLTDLYNEYKQKYPVKPVSRFVYEREFHQLNISIKRPHKDTCEKCDKLSMQINLHPTNNTLKDDLAHHHKLADLAYLFKKKDKTVTKDDPERKTITFDLQ